MNELWAMGINKIPSGGVVTPITSPSHNDAGFKMDAVFRANVYFPRRIELCNSSPCDNPDVYDASVKAVYTGVKRLGFSIGDLGQWANVPTVVEVTYKWVGVQASMTIDPIIYMDSLGQVFEGSLDIKVRAAGIC